MNLHLLWSINNQGKILKFFWLSSYRNFDYFFLGSQYYIECLYDNFNLNCMPDILTTHVKGIIMDLRPSTNQSTSLKIGSLFQVMVYVRPSICNARTYAIDAWAWIIVRLKSCYFYIHWHSEMKLKLIILYFLLASIWACLFHREVFFPLSIC